MKKNSIVVRGAREHNLKNVSLEMPRDQLVVITGVSGSGKSSLAFDTLYAEGQRRYVESLSAYARQFLGLMEKPDVDLIEGLSPAVAIQQKAGSRNPRSTVGTTTEIYDYFRLLFARMGTPHCPQCGRTISRQTIQQIVDRVLGFPEGSKLHILAPLISSRKGEYKKIFDQVRKDGFARVRVDGKLLSLDEDIPLEKNKKHDIEVVVDRLVLKDGIAKRLADSLETASKHGEGVVKVLVGSGEKEEEHLFSEHFACVHCGLSLEEPAPRSFSFNNPHGACPACTGMGYKMEAEETLVLDPEKSIQEGAVLPYANPRALYYQNLIEGVCQHFGVRQDVPFKKLPEKVRKAILLGTEEEIEFRVQKGTYRQKFWGPFEGVIPNLERRFHETDSESIREEIEDFLISKPCRSCKGTRLKPESLAVTIEGMSIIDVTRFSVKRCLEFFEGLKFDAKSMAVGGQILKEVKSRLSFLKNVGLDYLTLDRMTATLSGGEAQRIHLATQIGSALVGVLYILDEPSIGLHQRDNARLLDTLKRLRDIGNSVLVVEHDEDTMEEADFIVDMGLGAGVEGGEVVASGSLSDILAHPRSLTGQYLSGKKHIPVNSRKEFPFEKELVLKGARLNNLKDLTVHFPLGCLVAVTGVSGSGKSTLVMETLYPALLHQLYGLRMKPEGYESLDGVGHIDKVIEIDQSPIGRTPRSNPATYTGLFTHIRDLFAQLPESKARGYKEGRFSFNVKGGRCEACEGDGVLKIEMHFLPDVYVPCEVCKGKRYNRETLEIQYKGKNIAEILGMSVSEALPFFVAIPKVNRILETLRDVGLGYIKIGQAATTLSGGEAQRVKLSTELGKRSTGRTLYILDEPTTGLHFADVHHLIVVLKRLVEAGNSVVVIEHNLDVIKTADHIIDLGPEGGEEGGDLVAAGTVSQVMESTRSHTGRFLAEKVKKDLQRLKKQGKQTVLAGNLR
ncbi:MAG TPA: excinuclease ABC subunit UvrA, partial [bacterium]|nr:excinuclease ABC subunit UvrA [bacterium]